MRKTHFFASVTLAMSLGLTCLSSAANEENGRKGENLLAFIGEKISLEQQEPPPCDRCIMMDSFYVADYRVLDTVFGNYRGNTITFDVYDHYGEPRFSNSDTVLLFVQRRADGSYLHVKYQFAALYRGTDGEWYGCGDPYGYSFKGQRTVQARPMQFSAPVSFPLTDMSAEEIKRRYPADYFEVRDGHALCTMGTSVADLFQAKKESALTDYGIFK